MIKLCVICNLGFISDVVDQPFALDLNIQFALLATKGTSSEAVQEPQHSVATDHDEQEGGGAAQEAPG